MSKMLRLIEIFLLFILVSSTTFGQSSTGNAGPDRIVGGHEIDIRKAPYQVSVQFSGGHLCGGSIIRNNKILTAAHCIIIDDVKLFSIRAGSTYHAHGGIIVGVRKMVKHPQYNHTTFDYDFAVLMLEIHLPLSPIIQPIPLVIKKRQPNNVPTRVSGWGRLQYNKPGGSSVLQEVQVAIIENSRCNQLYPGRITDRMICAGFVAGGKDACQGDSGGPLVHQITRRLVGVVSWGIKCAQPNRPGVYANIAAVKPWIQTIR